MIGVLVALALAGCGAAVDSATAKDSGIEGVTMVGPGCPMSRESSYCPDKPLRAKLEITGWDSDEVLARTESGADGRFRIPLPPGSYVLHPANLSGSALPAAEPMPFKVGPHSFISVIVQFDSGIR